MKLVIERLPGLAIALVLIAFDFLFVHLARTAPAAVGIEGPIVCYLIAAAISCGVVIAVYYVFTGKDPL